MEDEARNVYREVQDRHVLRTADVYQTEIEDGVTGYSDTLLSVVATSATAAPPKGSTPRAWWASRSAERWRCACSP